MIEVTPHITLQDDEIQERFIRAAGPGGQNVNKVSTAVELRFDVRRSPSLTDAVAVRLMQERNRADALERLLALIRKAAEPPPPPRKKTKPTKASKERRLQAKSQRSGVKAMRGKVDRDD